MRHAPTQNMPTLTQEQAKKAEKIEQLIKDLKKCDSDQNEKTRNFHMPLNGERNIREYLNRGQHVDALVYIAEMQYGSGPLSDELKEITSRLFSEHQERGEHPFSDNLDKTKTQVSHAPAQMVDDHEVESHPPAAPEPNPISDDVTVKTSNTRQRAKEKLSMRQAQPILKNKNLEALSHIKTSVRYYKLLRNTRVNKFEFAEPAVQAMLDSHMRRAQSALKNKHLEALPEINASLRDMLDLNEIYRAKTYLQTIEDHDMINAFEAESAELGRKSVLSDTVKEVKKIIDKIEERYSLEHKSTAKIPDNNNDYEDSIKALQGLNPILNFAIKTHVQ